MFTNVRSGQAPARRAQAPAENKEPGPIQAAVQEAAMKAALELLARQGPAGEATAKGAQTLAQSLRELRLGREAIDTGLRSVLDDARQHRAAAPDSASTLQTLEKLDQTLNGLSSRIPKKEKYTDLEQLIRDDARNIRSVAESYRRYLAAAGKHSWADAEKAAGETLAGWGQFQSRHLELTSKPELSSTMRVLELPAVKK